MSAREFARTESHDAHWSLRAVAGWASVARRFTGGAPSTLVPARPSFDYCTSSKKNRNLKQIVADLSLHKAMLQVVVAKIF